VVGGRILREPGSGNSFCPLYEKAHQSLLRKWSCPIESPPQFAARHTHTVVRRVVWSRFNTKTSQWYNTNTGKPATKEQVASIEKSASKEQMAALQKFARERAAQGRSVPSLESHKMHSGTSGSPNKVPAPTVKGAGKIADPVPKSVSKNWNREVIKDAIRDYERSIAVRKAEAAEFDKMGGGDHSRVGKRVAWVSISAPRDSEPQRVVTANPYLNIRRFR